MRARIIKIIWLLLISVSILNLQVWIVRTLFPNAKEKNRIFGYTVLMWAIATWLILLYTYLLQPHIQTFLPVWSNYTNIRYSIFIALAWLIVALLLAKKKQRWRVFAVSTLTIIAIITWVVERLLVWSATWILILKATGEEVLKTSSSQSLTSHTNIFSSDVVLMSIMAGFWFALFENIVYFIQWGSIGWFFLRSLTTSLLHAIFTWVIWFILWKTTRLSVFSYVIAYLAGIGLHIFYNYIMGIAPVIWWIIFIMWGYFLLTYLLYKTDRMYLEG